MRAYIRRHKYVVAYLFLVVALLAGVYRLETITRENRAAFCALRDDIGRRLEVSREYLEKHPRGLVSPKTNAVIISPAEFRASQRDLARTLHALDLHITCP